MLHKKKHCRRVFIIRTEGEEADSRTNSGRDAWCALWRHLFHYHGKLKINQEHNKKLQWLYSG